MRAREGKAYYCEDCDCVLRYERRGTQFGELLLLIHDPFLGCKWSGSAFYVPRIEVAQFPKDLLAPALNGPSAAESAVSDPERTQVKD